MINLLVTLFLRLLLKHSAEMVLKHNRQLPRLLIVFALLRFPAHRTNAFFIAVNHNYEDY